MAVGEISFNQITFEVGAQSILRGISLSFPAQSTTALLGRSGSGKTTLLRTISGLVTPTGGEVTVRGRNVSLTDPIELRRGIGYVIQESGLFPHMTVGRNVALSYELLGRSGPDALARMSEVLGMTGLPEQEYAHRFPHELSGGQRQRVGLARALMSDPSILLMDEPFGALDPITRAEMQTMLHTLLLQVQKTTVIVTHDLEEALYLADRIVFLEHGAVVADLPSREVRTSRSPAIVEYINAIRRPEMDAASTREHA